MEQYHETASDMSDAELMHVSPWEMLLLFRAAHGETYAEIARAVGRQPKASGPGGGSKAGLVHWFDTHEPRWHQLCAASGEIASNQGDSTIVESSDKRHFPREHFRGGNHRVRNP